MNNFTIGHDIRHNSVLRSSFNELTRKIFCFDFMRWYEEGFWTDAFDPHVLMDGDHVIANVSVNRMHFAVCGEKREYLQLGTVMTENAYRKQGLNQQIMRYIFNNYSSSVNGIYLFGNDSAKHYYQKLGFEEIREKQYYKILSPDTGIRTKPLSNTALTPSSEVIKISCSAREEIEKYLSVLKDHEKRFPNDDPNDGFALRDNLGLIAFWLLQNYGKSVFYIRDQNAYVIAETKNETIKLIQVICDHTVDYDRICSVIAPEATKCSLGFTPRNKDQWQVKENIREDSTTFVCSGELHQLSEIGFHFPELSHA